MTIKPLNFLRAASLLATAFAVPSSAWAGDASPAVQAQPREIVNPAAVMPLEQLSATQERPLFSPLRHVPVKAPLIVPAASPPPAPTPPPSVALLGIIFGPDEPHAIIRSDSVGKIIHARVGDDIGGWQVTHIERQKVEMSLDDRSVDITLFADKRGGTVPVIHRQERVLEVDAAGALRSRPPHHPQ